MDEVSLKHKFEENLHLELKNGNATDSTAVLAFNRIAKELDGEGNSYSITRESFTKFFNDLSGSQQKEFLAMLSIAENESRNVYELAQEYNARLLQKQQSTK